MVSEGRVVHLEVMLTGSILDGQHQLGVRLVETPLGDYVIEVRPKGKRILYTGLMSDVCQFVAARHAKALAQAQGISVPRPRKGTSRI